MLGAYDTMGNQEFGSLPQSFLLLLITKLHRHIKLVEVTRIEDLTGLEHVISGCEHHPGNSDNGSFLTSALGDPLLFDAVVRGRIRFHSGMGRLHECGLEINPGPRNANRLLFAGGLIVAGR